MQRFGSKVTVLIRSGAIMPKVTVTTAHFVVVVTDDGDDIDFLSLSVIVTFVLDELESKTTTTMTPWKLFLDKYPTNEQKA